MRILISWVLGYFSFSFYGVKILERAGDNSNFSSRVFSILSGEPWLDDILSPSHNLLDTPVTPALHAFTFYF